MPFNSVRLGPHFERNSVRLGSLSERSQGKKRRLRRRNGVMLGTIGKLVNQSSESKFLTTLKRVKKLESGILPAKWLKAGD